MDKKKKDLLLGLLDQDGAFSEDVYGVRDQLYLKGLVTVNEMRDFIGLPPILNGDQILVKAGEGAYHPLLDIDGCRCSCCEDEEGEEKND